MNIRTKIFLLVGLGATGIGMFTGWRWLTTIEAIEWGVLVDIDSTSNQAQLAMDPTDSIASGIPAELADSIQWVSAEEYTQDYCSNIREPVMYFRSKVPLSLGVKVQFPGGNPTVSFPTAIRNRDSLAWNLDLCPFFHAPFDSFAGKLIHMHDPASTPIKVGEVTSSFLFYKGRLPKPPRLEMWSQPVNLIDTFELGVHNPSPFDLHDVCVVSRCHPSAPLVSACFDHILPGQTLTAIGGNPRRFLDRLLKQGLPEIQARSMDHFWGSQIEQTEGHRALTSWSYRVPQEALDSILPVTFSRSNVRLRRWIYVYHLRMARVTRCVPKCPDPECYGLLRDRKSLRGRR